MSLYVVIGILVVLIILLVAVIFPKRHDREGDYLKVAVRGLIDEYFIAAADADVEKKRLRLHRLTVATDRLLSKILAHFNIVDQSVKQQLRVALERNVLTYDQFRTLKQFHHMRNEVVHEGLQVYGDSEQMVYGALVVLKALLS